MIDIPLDAAVECADEPCGKSITVIANPVTRKVTHIVVKPAHSEARLVPLDQVVESSRDLVRLHCTQDELVEMEPFVEVRHVDKRGTDYAGPHFGADPYAFEATYASYTVETVPVEEERTPPVNSRKVAP